MSLCTRVSWCAAVLLAALMAVMGIGCGSAPHGASFQPEVVDNQHAVMYVYRESRLFGGPVRVVINQEAAGELRPGQYMAKVLPPGTYLVRVEAESSMVREIRLQPGDAAYLEVVGGNKPILQEPGTDVARQAIAKTARVGE